MEITRRALREHRPPTRPTAHSSMMCTSVRTTDVSVWKCVSETIRMMSECGCTAEASSSQLFYVFPYFDLFSWGVRFKQVSLTSLVEFITDNSHLDMRKRDNNRMICVSVRFHSNLSLKTKCDSCSCSPVKPLSAPYRQHEVWAATCVITQSITDTVRSSHCVPTIGCFVTVKLYCHLLDLRCMAFILPRTNALSHVSCCWQLRQ